MAEVFLCLAQHHLLDTREAPGKVLRNREQLSSSVMGLRKQTVPTMSAESPSDLGPPPLHHFNRMDLTLKPKKGEIRESDQTLNTKMIWGIFLFNWITRGFWFL